MLKVQDLNQCESSRSSASVPGSLQVTATTLSGRNLRLVLLCTLCVLGIYSYATDVGLLLPHGAISPPERLLRIHSTQSSSADPVFVLASSNDSSFRDASIGLLTPSANCSSLSWQTVEQWLSARDLPLLKAAGALLRNTFGLADSCEAGEEAEEALLAMANGTRVGHGNYLAMCVQIKNDARILDEFLAFHWLQGARHFVIYDDNSTDQAYSVLQKWVGLGVVDYRYLREHPSSGTDPLQNDNLNGCFEELRSRREDLGVRWVSFGDIDEFWMPRDQGVSSLVDLLNDRYNARGCLEVARTWIGSSYQHRRPKQGLVIELYQLASPHAGDGYPKLLANIRPDGNRTAKLEPKSLYSVHTFDDQWEKGMDCVSQYESRDIRINHYLRSIEDYEVKVKTGHKPMFRYSNDFSPFFIWWERDRNDLYDPLAARHACKVKALLAKIEHLVQEGLVTLPPAPALWYPQKKAEGGDELQQKKPEAERGDRHEEKMDVPEADEGAGATEET